MSFFAEAFAALLVACCLLAWAYLAARVRRGEPLVEFTPRRRVPWGPLDLFVVAAFFVAALILLANGLNLALNVLDGDVKRFEVAIAAGTGANVLTLAFATAWLVWRVGAQASDLGWRGESTGRDVKLGLVAFAAVSVPIYALQYILSQFNSQRHPIIEVLDEQPSGWLFLLSGISAVAVAPIAEEFFFRGLLQGWLESQSMRLEVHVSPAEPQGDDETLAAELLGREPDDSPYRSPVEFEAPRGVDTPAVRIPTRQRGPIVITSALFALMHWGHGFAPVPLFFLSLALGWLYQRTHRLLPSIVVHFCLNACSMMMLPFALNAE